ncbi:hypothetical protein U1Q18_007488 [Sarracenia purpurea var. burkii]
MTKVYTCHGDSGSNASSLPGILASQVSVHNPEYPAFVVQMGFCPLHQLLLDTNLCFINSVPTGKQLQQHNPKAIYIALHSQPTCQQENPCALSVLFGF